MYAYIYIYTIYSCVCVYTYIYIYILYTHNHISCPFMGSTRSGSQLKGARSPCRTRAAPRGIRPGGPRFVSR